VTDINPTYYSLVELIAQRENSLEFQVDSNVTAGIEMEIALVVERQSMADRINGVQQNRAAMNKARDILDERAPRIYDQDNDGYGPPDLSQSADH
jgi:transcriptional regulatory protein LevR